MENILVSSTATELRIESGGDMENGSNKTNPIGERKKIQFHLAKKEYSALSNCKGSSNGDFWIETLNPDARKRPFGLDRRPVQCQGQTGKRVGGSDFGESGLDPELCFGITFRRIGAGLENLGNTCFLNSVVQCLTYTEPLAAYLQSGKHQNSCHIAGFCALCAIQKHVSCALQSTGRSLVPKDLVSNLRCISRNFRNARQEDAHEYMVNLLESMHKCCLPSGVPSESPAAYEKSLVHKIFGGRLRSQVQCQQCLYCSNKFDPFLDLSLEITKTDTLPAALRNFTAPEMLDGGEKHYQCQRCKQKVKAKKRLTVDKAPYVLTIHLKRFHAHDPGRKVDRKVIFDCSLDMKPFVSGSHEEDLNYSLYGVLVHFGHNTHSGHYVCFVRTSGGMWYYLNDNEVRQVSEKAVLEQKAYMLFYVRDRKNIAPRKPVVVQKENLKGAMSSDLANLVAKQLSKEYVDNGLIVSGVEATNSGATMDRKGASSTSLEIHPKDTSLQQNNRHTLQKSSMQKVDLVLESSTVLPKDPSEGAASGNLYLGDSLPPSAPSLNSVTVASELESASVISGAKICDCNEPSSGSGGPEKSANDKLVTDETSQKINVELKEGASCQMPCGDSSDEKACNFSRLSPSVESTFDKTDNEKSLDKPNCESNQGGAIPNVCATGEATGDKAADTGQGIVHPPTEPSIPITSVVPNGCSHSKAHDCTPKKKLKKKLPRCGAHLGSPFFKISLAMHKRKKHKKSKRCFLETKNLMLEQLDDNGLSSELGPSTSRISSTVLVASKSSWRNVVKTDSRKGENPKKCSESRMDVVDGEFVNRNNQNGAVPAMDKHIQKSTTSIVEVNQLDAREHDSTEKGKMCASQNGLMSALSWGLEGTAVARWDGIELPSQIVESNGGEKIGYVPDEWDEEYDRGKRKKIRQSKLDFSGPNPFQEIATKKTQIKKAKMDRSRSGNQPFRI